MECYEAQLMEPTACQNQNIGSGPLASLSSNNLRGIDNNQRNSDASKTSPVDFKCCNAAASIQDLPSSLVEVEMEDEIVEEGKEEFLFNLTTNNPAPDKRTDNSIKSKEETLSTKKDSTKKKYNDPHVSRSRTAESKTILTEWQFYKYYPDGQYSAKPFAKSSFNGSYSYIFKRFKSFESLIFPRLNRMFCSGLQRRSRHTLETKLQSNFNETKKMRKRRLLGFPSIEGSNQPNMKHVRDTKGKAKITSREPPRGRSQTRNKRKSQSIFCLWFQNKQQEHQKEADMINEDNTPTIHMGLSLAETLKNQDEVTKMFREFLEQEFSDENLDFWLEVERYKKLEAFEIPAQRIFNKFIAGSSPREINIEFQERKEIKAQLSNPNASMFDDAQRHIFKLMERDSFRRFLARYSENNA